jgi:hypothetical protein
VPIDPVVALRATIPPFSSSWDADDVILYHLGIGAGLGREGDRILLSAATRERGQPVLSNAAIRVR